MPGLGDNIKDILAGAPELVHMPGVAVGIAQGVSAPQTGPIDPYGAAQAASLAASNVGAQRVVSDQQSLAPAPQHHGLFGDIEGAVSGAVGDVVGSAEQAGKDVLGVAAPAVSTLTKAMNYPLTQVQHYYRTLHDMWTRYGVFSALETEATAPFGGTALHATKFAKSWDVTSNGTTYRDVHGNAVNAGYDLMNVVDHVVNGHDYMPQGWTRDQNGVMQPTSGGGVDLPTGIINAVFDLTYDPTLKVGKVAEGIKAAGGIIIGAQDAEHVTLAAKAADRTNQLMDLAKNGKAVQITADGKSALVGGRVLVKSRVPQALVDFDGNRATNIPQIVANNPGVRDMFGTLANKSTEQILNDHPMLAPLAGELGKAKNIGEVANVFERGMTARNYQFLQKGLPSTSLTRRIVQKAVGTELPTMAKIGAQIGDSNKLFRAATTHRPFAVDSRTLQLSSKTFDPDDPAFIKPLQSALRISQDHATANAIVAKYIDAPDLGTRISILSTNARDAVRAFAVGHGLTDEQVDQLPAVQKLTEDVDFMHRNVFRPIYGMGEDGLSIFGEDPATGEPINLGLFHNQTGKVSLPDFNELRKQVAEVKGGPAGWMVKADDWVYNHYTTRVFKNLALMSMGFAFRVASGELVPAILQNSGREVVGSSLMAQAARLNPGLRDLASEYGEDALKGVRVRTEAGDVAKVASVKGGTVTLDNGETHVLTKLDGLHRPMSDQDVQDAADKMNIEISKKEIPHYKAAIGKALYGVGRGLVDPDYYDAAVRNVMTLDGHLVAPGLAAGHDIPGTGAGPAEDFRHYLEQAGARLPKKPQQLADTFTTYSNNASEHPMFWQFAANEAAQDPGVKIGAKAYLDAIRSGASKDEATKAFTDADANWMKTGVGDDADKFRYSMALHGQGADAYSKLRARALKGLIHGSTGRLNEDVLAGIAGERDMPGIAELANKPMEMRPLAVKGREIEDTPKTGGLDRMTQWGWRKFLNPTINQLSRAPIYTMKTAQEYKFFKPWVDSGLMDPMEAHQIAQVRAANGMLPLIHNTKLRSQMSDVMRNVVPFYFAQEQAYKRYGKVITADPMAFRKALIAVHALGNSGLMQQDANGNKTLVLPGTGELAKYLTIGASAFGLPVLGGIPSVISGDMISLKSVVPEGNLPSVSPIVAVPLKEIQNMFPATEPMISKVIGSVNESESNWDMVVPNATLKRALQATPILDRESGFATSYANNIIYASYRSQVLNVQAQEAQRAGNKQLATKLFAEANHYMPGPNADPFQRQAALDRIKHATRIQVLVKAGIGTLSPLSPVMNTGDVAFTTEVQADMKKYGVAQGLQNFLAKHPYATAYTVFDSDNSTTGTALPATKDALDWVQKNRGWVQGHALAAAYLIPQTAQAFNVEAYNQELAMGLRSKKSPQQLLTSIYAAATDPEYYSSLDSYEKAQTAATGNSFEQEQLSSSWAQYKQGLANANPVWAASQNDPTKVEVARQTLHQLQTTLDEPGTPQSPQTSIATELVNSYNSYVQAQADVRAGQLPNTTLSQLQDSFNDYLDGEVKQTPAASALVTGVFRRLVNAED